MAAWEALKTAFLVLARVWSDLLRSCAVALAGIGRDAWHFIASGKVLAWLEPISYAIALLYGLWALWRLLAGLWAKVSPDSRAARAFLAKSREVARNAGVYHMLLPTVILLLIFNVYPALSIVKYAFYRYELGGQAQFVGLDNFRKMLTDDPILGLSVKTMLKFMAFSLATGLTIPLIAAELIFHLKTERARYWARVLFVVPMVVPLVVYMLIWGVIYSDAGIISLACEAVGLGDLGKGLLSNPKTARLAVMFVGFPFVHGMNLLIYYAGLSNIPQSIHDAAKVDGASVLQTFFHVDIPMIMGQFKLLLILGIIFGLQQFENIYILTNGGPGWETMVPGLHMFRYAFVFKRWGYACAVGLVLFLVVLIVTVANMKLIRSSVEYQA